MVSFPTGEVVTIPVGHWHAVRNTAPTISVNESMLFPEDLPQVCSLLTEMFANCLTFLSS